MDKLNKGKISRKRVIDSEGIWIYDFFFDWKYPEIISIRRIADKKEYV